MQRSVPPSDTEHGPLSLLRDISASVRCIRVHWTFVRPAADHFDNRDHSICFRTNRAFRVYIHIHIRTYTVGLCARTHMCIVVCPPLCSYENSLDSVVHLQPLGPSSCDAIDPAHWGNQSLNATGKELAVVAAEAFAEFEDTKHTRECLEVYFGESMPCTPGHHEHADPTSGGALGGLGDAAGSGSAVSFSDDPGSTLKLDQFYVRALFVKGRLMQHSAVVDANLRGHALQTQTLQSAQFIIRGMEMALSPTLGLERYKFLVYNGSVHFWRITHFLQCDGLLRREPSVGRHLAAIGTRMM